MFDIYELINGFSVMFYLSSFAYKLRTCWLIAHRIEDVKLKQTAFTVLRLAWIGFLVLFLMISLSIKPALATLMDGAPSSVSEHASSLRSFALSIIAFMVTAFVSILAKSNLKGGMRNESTKGTR